MGVKMYDAASNAVSVTRGFADVIADGPNAENLLQIAGGAGGLGASLPQKCFTAGTQIVVGAEFTDDDVFVQYVTQNIEDIEKGDLVWSYDTLTGDVVQKEVTDVFVRESDHINYLAISDENGDTQIIETTDGHPFWVVTDNPDLSRAASEAVLDGGDYIYHENISATESGYWVEAKDLRVGDVFLGANGELSTLLATERVQFDESVTVYNFRVEGNHDYFVIAKGENGYTSILVHNGNGSYTNYFNNGKYYDGKGDYARAKASAKRIENMEKKRGNNVKNTDIDWTPAPDRDTSFMDEARRIRGHRDGVGDDNPNTYNKINSPGEVMLRKRGE